MHNSFMLSELQTATKAANHLNKSVIQFSHCAYFTVHYDNNRPVELHSTYCWRKTTNVCFVLLTNRLVFAVWKSVLQLHYCPHTTSLQLQYCTISAFTKCELYPFGYPIKKYFKHECNVHRFVRFQPGEFARTQHFRYSTCPRKHFTLSGGSCETTRHFHRCLISSQLSEHRARCTLTTRQRTLWLFDFLRGHTTL